MLAPVAAKAQFGQSYFIHSHPYPIYGSATPGRGDYVVATADPSENYNFKWGRVLGRFRASTQFEFNDNINLSNSEAESDFIISPNVGANLLWPISQNNTLQFDIGVGYRWYINHSSLNSVFVTPSTQFEYRIKVEEVQISLFDSFFVQVDPTDRREISGASGDLIIFRRIVNVSGLQAFWRANSETEFFGGYSFTLDRSLSDDFSLIDRNSHTLNTGASYDLSPRWTVGATTFYTITDYINNIQNDGNAYGAGPFVIYRPTENIMVRASASYVLYEFDRSGAIADTSEFQGLTINGGVTHTINNLTDHALHLSKNVDVGLGSNFTDVFTAGYVINRKLTAELRLNAGFTFETFSASGPGGEDANRYLFHLGTHFQLSRDWSAGIFYSLSLKDSELANRDYVQNRVVLDVTRNF